MDQKEIKSYIIKNWNTSSGKRLTLMLQKYWKIQSDKNGEKSKTAEDLAKEVGLIA